MAESPQPRSRSRVRRVLAWPFFILAVVAGILVAIIAFFAVALATSNIPALCLAALVACFLVSAALGGLGAWVGGYSPRRTLALRIGIGTALLVALVAALTMFRPLAPPAQRATLPLGAAFWDLPTGSHIAYRRIPAAGAPRATPIVRVHGGPGAFAVLNQEGIDYFGQLAQDGFDVYFYDQIGSGLSARLDNPAEYTVTRHVEDLEAIRKQIGAEQMVLIGESWGGTLVANYMAAYPQQVAKAIFTSPAAINPAEWEETQDMSRLSADQQQEINRRFMNLRFGAVMLLQGLNPRAAHAFASDDEMDNWFGSFASLSWPVVTCQPNNMGDIPNGLFGFWANMMVHNSFHKLRVNPREQLLSNQTPVLILRGECDHILWQVTREYRDTFPRSTLLFVPQAGHIIYYEQPALHLSAMRAFLLDRPLPLPPYTGSTRPDNSQ